MFAYVGGYTSKDRNGRGDGVNGADSKTWVEATNLFVANAWSGGRSSATFPQRFPHFPSWVASSTPTSKKSCGCPPTSWSVPAGRRDRR